MLVAWLLSVAFWLWMINDCLGNRQLSGVHRMAWLLVVLVLPGAGALLYFLLVKGGRGSRPLV